MVTSASTEKRTRYFNPFPGKPAPLDMSGLFLLSPTVHDKLCGHSWSGLFAEQGCESLYKRALPVIKGKAPGSIELLNELVDSLVPKGSDEKILIDIKAAAEGDASAAHRIAEMGAWEAYFAGCGVDSSSLAKAHILAIERASIRPQRLFSEGKFSEVAHALQSDKLFRNFLWPKAIDLMRSASDATKLLSLQASITLEAHLSYLAVWDIEYGSFSDINGTSLLTCVLPSPDKPGKNPTSLFFHWLKKESGEKTIASFQKSVILKGISIDVVTLKRWSSGAHHPDIVWLRGLLKAIFGDPDYPRALHLYWGAKYLNLLGYLAQRCTEKANRLVGSELEGSLAPWPSLPFEHPDFASWCQVRYAFWWNFHKDVYLKGRQAQG